MIRRILLLLSIVLVAALAFFGWRAYQTLDYYQVFKTPVYETEPPILPASIDRDAVLVFSKTNSYRHWDAIAAAEVLFTDIAKQENWPLFITENAAIHNPEQLARFRLIIWNNNTGDVLTEAQQEALRDWIESGGQWLGLHGAGGSREYGWDWYADELLKARFIGHTMFPQFPEATIVVEDREHPSTRHLPERWTREEEWYSFLESPRAKGVQVLASLDENSYAPKLDLLMDGDHPLIWWHEIGQGTVFYSALGHRGEAYEEPEYRELLHQAARWLMHAATPALDADQAPVQ